MQKKQNKTKFKSGFSLMELLIVIAIAMIMTGIVFVWNNGSSAPLDVKNATQQVRTQLSVLQNEALTGKRIENAAGVWENACSFKLEKDGADQSAYVVSYYTECSSTPNAASLIKSSDPVKLKNVSITINGAGYAIYQSPHGNSNTATIDIVSNKNSEENAQVVVTSS